MKARKLAGFTLIEVLIAVVVVAVGLLSVSSLQTRLVRQNGESTARAEAMALAQARIEEMRNYTDTISTEDQFNTAFAQTAGFANGVTIDGNNATFTRTESIQPSGTTTQVDVQVAWLDRTGVNQNVVLSTKVAFQSPRAAGDLARLPSDPTVPSPTGRARLGEGRLPQGAPTTPNGDGTAIYVNGPNKMLVVDGNIVLTLPDSCNVYGTCLDFVKINGRVYIDTATQNTLKPGAVHVQVTDAGYCHRYYVDSRGASVTVTNSTTTVASTPSGNYKYFDYRCYIGGGWHGNVGIVLDGGLSQTDKVCQGDPTATEAYKRPVIAARRAYRGMLYKVDSSTVSGKEEDALGNPIYYSIGIGDGTVLPDPTNTPWVSGGSYSAGTKVVYASYVYLARVSHSGSTANPKVDTARWLPLGSKKTHDFVISRMPVDATAGSKCIENGVMVRTDSKVNGTLGDRFAGMPTDFVCLNPAYVDTFSSPFAVSNNCPYDPTTGTPVRHLISGAINATALTDNALLTLSSLVDLISINTSDGAGNCFRTTVSASPTLYSIGYVCEVYEWGSGWTGYIEVDSNTTSMLCLDSGADGVTDNRLNLTGVTQDTSVGSASFLCTAGNLTVIQGTVSTANVNKTLKTATISVPNAWCSVETGGLAYQCVTGIYGTSTWSGTITFAPSTTNGAYICGSGVDPATGVATLSALPPGTYTLNLGIVSSVGATCPQ